MRSYSTREVAELVGDSQQRVRAAARAGFVSPTKNTRGHYRFSFQDVVLLRSTKALESEQLGVRRMWRALRATRSFLPRSRPLSSVRVVAVKNQMLIQDNNTSWDPERRQSLFDFAAAPTSRAMTRCQGGPSVIAAASGDDWFERGLRLDRAEANEEAARCYRKAIELDEDQVNARINLGRILHGWSRYAEAESLYREALARDGDHAIAAFNLGVVLEDQGRPEAAIESYLQALRGDPSLPDAHYNLARLYGGRGERELAARHLLRFRALSSEDA